ncbi:MAG: RpoL/Rpb11 RNA polymerase subunit family protein [Fervidicoccaceae archaeon]
MKIISINIPSQNELEIEIEGETHTLGSMLSKELLLMEEVDVAYYVQEHPLKNVIKLYVKTKEGYSPLDILEKAVERLKNKLDEIEKEIEKAL